jgi:hypothetical protein
MGKLAIKREIINPTKDIILQKIMTKSVDVSYAIR